MDKINSKQSWFLGKTNTINFINDLISNVKWPHDFHKKVSLLENVNVFKASKMKNLSFYLILAITLPFYSMPENKNMWHWLAIYVEISQTITCDKVLKSVVENVEKLVTRWLKLLSHFKTVENQVYNAHALLHLPKYVRLFGPVHHFFTFTFEGLNMLYCCVPTNAHSSLMQIARRFCPENT